MPLHYAILRHEGIRQPHFDLLFETAPAAKLLAAWRSPVWPIKSAQRIDRIADHRRLYLDYDGPLTDGRGYVRPKARGQCEIAQQPDLWIIRILPNGPTLRLERAGDRWMATPAGLGQGSQALEDPGL